MIEAAELAPANRGEGRRLMFIVGRRGVRKRFYFWAIIVLAVLGAWGILIDHARALRPRPSSK